MALRPVPGIIGQRAMRIALREVGADPTPFSFAGVGDAAKPMAAALLILAGKPLDYDEFARWVASVAGGRRRTRLGTGSR
jgi:hypothetical protein